MEISKSDFKSKDEASKVAEDIMIELYGDSSEVLWSVK